ncbi:hypothetical protein CAEBREN_26340 [Caenorhabditis brenneri]|uniref:Uncharacterized protein n=2 Tax=Caenorhabditis brenneri TaxID=135651 RepID=G0NED6_CAEBE|nr:hypothetical protein CAEBREN_26340 [Caenorhabditis brenneri]
MSLKMASRLTKNAVLSATRNFTNGPRLPTKLLHAKPGFVPKYVSADEALAMVESNNDIYVGNHASAPNVLLEALCRRVDSANLTNIRMSHLILSGNCPQFDPKYQGKILNNSLFICPGNRKNVNLGIADYTPIFLSEVPSLYTSGALNVDVALITVSPPDELGFCTLGVDIDCTLAAATSAKKIIALVNSTMPRTRGHTTVHSSHFAAMVQTDRPIAFRQGNEEMSETEQKIGKIIAENLVDNGATLQLGIGAIPDSALAAMKQHKDLGVHTEMFSDGVIDLIDRGIINNQKKAFMPGKTVSSFAFGTKEFYKKIDNNPEFYFAPCDFTNHIDIVRRNSKMTSINSAIEIDLTGQIVSDSIGRNFFSGFGGQVDFMAASPHGFDGLGKAIIALPSRTTKGHTKIVPFLTQGSGVVTTRAHARYIVTEHGIANLWGKSIRQRAYELIQISHPDDREKLEKAAFDRFKVMPSP